MMTNFLWCISHILLGVLLTCLILIRARVAYQRGRFGFIEMMIGKFIFPQTKVLMYTWCLRCSLPFVLLVVFSQWSLVL
jgi:hypothetical protein